MNRPNAQDMKVLANMMKSTIGFDLQDYKTVLVRTRLQKVALKHNMNLDEFLDYVNAKGTSLPQNVMMDIINKIVTFETYFFREDKHIKSLVDMVKELIDGGKNSVRIWSAGASFGQEPYSILMAIHSILGQYYYNKVTVVATDYSDYPLQRVKSGKYSKNEIGRCTTGWQHILNKYVVDMGDDVYKINLPDITNRLFTSQHLLVSEKDNIGLFDIIFCKNVMIYMDTETREKVLTVISKHMSHDTKLFVGMSESLHYNRAKNTVHRDEWTTYYKI